MKNFLSRSIFLFFFCCISFSSPPAQAVDFFPSDLAGDWSGYFLESTGDSSYWISGVMSIDLQGTVTGGTWVAASGATGTFVDGSLVMDKGGVLTGTIRTHEEGDPPMEIKGMALSHGKMNQGKDLVHGVVLKNNGNMDLVTFVRKGGASYEESDIVGDWFGFFHSTDGEDARDCWTVDMGIGLGEGASSGTWNFLLAAGSGSLNGKFAMNSTGSVGYELLSSGDDSSTLFAAGGQMAESKTAFATIDGRSDSSLDFGLYLKTGGSGYQVMDLQGTWAGYIFQSTADMAYWVYGAIRLDANGQFVWGRWEAVDGTEGRFTGGGLVLSQEGLVTGSLSTSDGGVFNVMSGAMDAGKSMMATVGSPGQGIADLAFFLKMEPGFTWPAFPWPIFLPSMTQNR